MPAGLPETCGKNLKPWRCNQPFTPMHLMTDRLLYLCRRRLFCIQRKRYLSYANVVLCTRSMLCLSRIPIQECLLLKSFFLFSLAYQKKFKNILSETEGRQEGILPAGKLFTQHHTFVLFLYVWPFRQIYYSKRNARKRLFLSFSLVPA